MPTTRSQRLLKRSTLAERSANVTTPENSDCKLDSKQPKRDDQAETLKTAENLTASGKSCERKSPPSQSALAAPKKAKKEDDRRDSMNDGNTDTDDCDCELGDFKHSRKLHSWGSHIPIEVFSYLGLPGERDDAVEVYDTCDEIRRKITEHLISTKMSVAALARNFHTQLHGPRRTKLITGAQLSDFRKKSGSRAGNTSTVFYAAYVYFEKDRLLRGKEKSEHRLDMEDIWLDGFEVKELPHNMHFIVGRWSKHSCFGFDEYGEEEWL
jgi:hypothetical protein